MEVLSAIIRGEKTCKLGSPVYAFMFVGGTCQDDRKLAYGRKLCPGDLGDKTVFSLMLAHLIPLFKCMGRLKITSCAGVQFFTGWPKNVSVRQGNTGWRREGQAENHKVDPAFICWVNAGTEWRIILVGAVYWWKLYSKKCGGNGPERGCLSSKRNVWSQICQTAEK